MGKRGGGWQGSREGVDVCFHFMEMLTLVGAASGLGFCIYAGRSLRQRASMRQ